MPRWSIFKWLRKSNTIFLFVIGSNYVRQASNPDIMEKFLESDPGGNLPAMVAALNNKKEALHQLLVPFMTSPEKETLGMKV